MKRRLLLAMMPLLFGCFGPPVSRPRPMAIDTVFTNETSACREVVERRRSSTRIDVAGGVGFWGLLLGLLYGGLSYGDGPADDGGSRVILGGLAGVAVGAGVGYLIGSLADSDSVIRRIECPASSSAPGQPAPPGRR